MGLASGRSCGQSQAAQVIRREHKDSWLGWNARLQTNGADMAPTANLNQDPRLRVDHIMLKRPNHARDLANTDGFKLVAVVFPQSSVGIFSSAAMQKSTGDEYGESVDRSVCI